MSVFDKPTAGGSGMTEEQYNALVQDTEFENAIYQLGNLSQTIAQRVVDYGSVGGELREFVGNVNQAYVEIAGTRKNTIGFTSLGKRTNAFKSLAMATYANVNFGSYEGDMGVLATTQSPIGRDKLAFVLPVMGATNERIVFSILGVSAEGAINPPEAQQTKAYLRPRAVESFNSDGTITRKEVNITDVDYLTMAASQMFEPPAYKIAYSTGEVSDGTEQGSVDRVKGIITTSTNKHIYDGEVICFKTNTGLYYIGFVNESSSIQFIELIPTELDPDNSPGQIALVVSYLTLNEYWSNTGFGSYVKGCYTNGRFFGTLPTEQGNAGLYNNGIETPVLYYYSAPFVKLSETAYDVQGTPRVYIVPAFKGTFNIGNDVYFVSANKKIYKALPSTRGDTIEHPNTQEAVAIYSIQEVCEGDFDLIKYAYTVKVDGSASSAAGYAPKWIGLKNVGYVNEQSCVITEDWLPSGINKTVNNVYEVFDLSNVATVANYTKKLAIKTMTP